MLPVLHVGFHKCGSTTLQGAVFHRHPEVFNLGEPDEDANALRAMRDVWSSCHENPKKRTQFNPDRSRSLWQEALAKVPPGQVPVFSKETLTLSEFYAGPDDQRIPTRLHSVTGPARIVIVVRHQIRLIESLYLYQAKGARYEASETWLQSRGDALRLYRYYTVAASFAEVFGRENVGIFLFEEMKTDAAAFARHLCNFIGVDADQGAQLIKGERRNKRVSARFVAYSKLRKALGMNIPLGRMVPETLRLSFNNFVAGGSDARIRLPAAWASEMEHHFRDDNCRLAQEWDLPLEKYGYPL